MLARGVREEGLDKFYTIPEVAERCLRRVEEFYPWAVWGLVVEPSAGGGSFFHRIGTEKKIGMDVSPDHGDILPKDFFTFSPERPDERILVVGNPPFGKNSSLAVKFFNHAAIWAEVIAFIVPRTFRRISLQNRLNPFFHLLSDEDIPTEPCAFDPPMMAKCCFQIWERRNTPRERKILSTEHPDWDFLALGPKDENGQPTPPIGADFVIRAYGGRCGEILEMGLETLRPKSWHWIRANLDKSELTARFGQLDYSLSLDTARQNSLGKGELVKLYSERYG